MRVSIFGLLIGLLFMSLVARLYAIQMTWGSNGPLASFGMLIGVPARSAGYAAIQVAMGLLHFVLPMAAPALISDSGIQELAKMLVANGQVSNTSNTQLAFAPPATTSVNFGGDLSCEVFVGGRKGGAAK